MSRRRRWLRRVGLVIASLISVIVIAVLVVVWVPAASQRVARLALERWDAAIPGEVEWRSMSGSIGAGLVLEELELRDGEDRPLIHADALVVDLDISHLFRAQVHLERVHGRGVEVWVDHDWGALAAPSDDIPDEPREGLGPELPVWIGASIKIEDLSVYQDDQLLVSNQGLALSLAGIDRSARAELELSGAELPQQQLRVDRLALALAWDEPTVTLERLELETPLGQLRTLEPSHLDLETSTADLAFELEGDMAQLADWLEIPQLQALDPASVQVRGRVKDVGDGEGLRAELLVTGGLGPETTLALVIDASPGSATTRRAVNVRLNGELGAGVLDEGIGAMTVGLDAALSQTDAGAYEATVELRAHEHDGDARLALDAGGRATSLSPPRGSAWLELRGPSLEVSATATSTDTQELDASWSIVVDELARVLELVAPLVDEPRLADLRGSLALTGSCASEPGRELETTRCPISLELDHVAGFDTRIAHASLTGEVTPLAEPLEFNARLEVEELATANTVVLDEAVLTVAGTPAKISVDARGHGMQERFELVAGLALDGPDKRVDLDELVLVSSRGAVPARFALAAPTQIVIGPERVDVRDLRAYALGGLVAVDGHVALAAGPSDLRVDLHGIDLARIDALIPGPHLSGRVDLEAQLRGRLDQPAGWAWLETDALEIGVNHLGSLQLAANLCGPTNDPGERPGPMVDAAPYVGHCGSDSEGELQLWLRNSGPIAKTVELDARLPLRFGAGAGVGLRARRELEARAVVRELDLVELGGLMPPTPSWWRQIPPDSSAPPGEPRLIPEGRLDLELTVSGSTSRPHIQLSLGASELVIDRTELGAVAVTATLDDAELELDLAAALTMAKLDLHAELPIQLDLARQKISWDRESEQVVELVLLGLELDALERILGPKLPALGEALALAQLGGRISASVSGRGRLSDPWLSAALNADELTHAGAKLGDGRVELELRDGEGIGTLALVGPLAGRLDARVEVPMHVSLAGEPRVRFDPTARMHAQAHVHGIELGTLEQHLGTLPVAGRGDLDVSIRGSLADPKLELAARLANLKVADERAGDLTVYARVDSESANIETDLVRRGVQLVAADLRIPLTIELADPEHARIAWRRDGIHQLSVHAPSIDHELLIALTGGPSDLELDTDLRLDVDGSGTASAFTLTAALDGRVAADNQTSFAIHSALTLDQAHQQLALVIDPNEGEGLTVEAGLDADVARLVSGELAVGKIPFSLEVEAPGFALDLLAPLVAPALHDPRGMLYAMFSGSGVLAAPQLAGTLAIHDGAVTVLALRQRLRDIELDVSLDNKLVDLRTLSITAGRGQISASGRANIDPSERHVDAKLAVELADIPIVRPGLPAMTINAKAKLELDRSRTASRIYVALADTKVEVAGSSGRTPKPIPSSDSVVFVSDQASASGAVLTDASPEEPTVDRVGSKLELRLAIIDPVLIIGPSIDMAWDGTLGITRTEAGLEVDGQLEAERGRLELLGHRFELRRGLVNLPTDGSLDPFLDIIAETSTAEADVTVTVRGRASEPELRFSSSPALTDYQIVTLLLTGSTELGQGDGEVETKAASLLAAFSNPELQRQLNRYLGIDQAKLGFGDSVDQPILSIGKRVTPNVFVETTYHHNAPEDENTAEVGVEYDFAKNWSLETYFGDAAVGGVGFYWTHSFGPVQWRIRGPEVEPPAEPDP